MCEDCPPGKRRREMCNYHYMQWYKQNRHTIPQLTIEDRFWEKVDITPGCWWWCASTNDDGYDHFRVEGSLIKAHRFSWELHFGAIPKDLRVLHTCDTPPCVNPFHLWLGTQRDNVLDMCKKGRLGGTASYYRPDLCANNPNIYQI